MTIVPGVVVAFSKAFIPLIALLRVGRSVMYLKVINDIIKANPFPSIDRFVVICRIRTLTFYYIQCDLKGRFLKDFCGIFFHKIA